MHLARTFVTYKNFPFANMVCRADHAIPFHFFDDGGFQMWHHIGIKQTDLTKNGMGVVVANISIDFVQFLMIFKDFY